MTVEIRVSPQAVAQARAAQEWWEANRAASPSLLHEELTSGLELLTQFPEVGSPYPNEQVPGVRRLLLRKCQYHCAWPPTPTAEHRASIGELEPHERQG